MLFTEAFRALGYEVRNPQNQWSAENDTGVCITLWKSEMGIEDKLPWVDTRVHAQDNALWCDKPGNIVRKRHLQRALAEFGGYVDVVIVHGIPGKGVRDSDPWRPSERAGVRWRVEDFDLDTGHFVVRPVR